jgi:hypothetical protein
MIINVRQDRSGSRKAAPVRKGDAGDAPAPVAAISAGVAQLRHELARDPDWAPFVQHWMQTGAGPQVTLEALRRARAYMQYRARGWPPERLRRWW